MFTAYKNNSIVFVQSNNAAVAMITLFLLLLTNKIVISFSQCILSKTVDFIQKLSLQL